MKYVSQTDLDQMIADNKDFQLIDVRESYEFEDNKISGIKNMINIPLAEILDNIDKIDITIPVIFCCQSGKRSGAMVHTLERKFNMTNLFTLEGGMESYLEYKS